MDFRKFSAIKIHVGVQDSFSFDLTTSKDVLAIDNCERPLLLGFKRIEADPFLFVHKGRLYLFYEEAADWTGKGIIKMRSTSDLENWTDAVTVLEEGFHLSYPWVFRDDATGRVYMMPETGATKEVRLYEATDDSLTAFRHSHTLLADSDEGMDISFCDSSVLRKDNKYFLHTTRQKDGRNMLELYVADSLTGPYKPHPMSPLLHDQRFGRNGGCVLAIDGHYYRPAQDCSTMYGGDLGLFEITELTADSYEEKLLSPSIILGKDAFHRDGGHHFNSVKFGDKYVVATDALCRHRFIAPRIAQKIKNIIKRK